MDKVYFHPIQDGAERAYKAFSRKAAPARPPHPQKTLLARSDGPGNATGAAWLAWYKTGLPFGHKEDSKTRIDGQRPDAQSFAGIRGALRAGLPTRPLPAHPGCAGASATCAPWTARRNPARSRDAAACLSETSLLSIKARSK